jgi:two-component system OmpR family sensor kinase
MSLRRRLVVGMLVLLVLAVGVTDVVTQSYLRSYLYGRLDEQNDVAQSQAYGYIDGAYARAVQAGDRALLEDPAPFLDQLALPPASPLPLSGAFAGAASPAPPTSAIPAAVAEAVTAGVPRAGRLSPVALAVRISPDVYLEIVDRRGQVVFRRPSGSAQQPDPPPRLPAALPVSYAPPAPRFGTSHGPYLPSQPSVTLEAGGAAGPYYLAEALAVPGGVLVTASPIAPLEQTLASLLRVEVVVSAAVVAVLVALVLWTVRLGLRPLEEMTATARAIAGGDLRRRVRRSDERSEVGRLGSALNGMLSQIESAFAQRTASEGRLRRFVADASHELRTPLTSIRGYAELLRKGALADEAARRRAAERIEHEAARMGVLVDDLLLLARLDQGRPLERAEVDLAELAARAVEAARAADGTHPITLDAGGPVVVEGDAVRLRQVVDNLLGNAQLHTPPGTAVRVEVGAGGGRARLVVADEGPGLGPGEAERVFDRFYRGASARGRPGTGLGLSIVAALAAAHGGSAWARARPGGGVEFVVELPLGSAVPEGSTGPGPRPSALAHPSSGAGVGGGGAPPAPGVGADGTMSPRAPDVGEPARR